MQNAMKLGLIAKTFICYPRLSEEEFLRIAEVNAAAINAATEGLPQDKV